jgi:hypothetical protein
MAKKIRKRKLEPWLRKIVAIIHGPRLEVPETLVDEMQKPLWARKLAFLADQLDWVPLWSRHQANNAKVVGCYVGKHYAMDAWLRDQCKEGLPDYIVQTLRDGFHQLEVEMGAGEADELIAMYKEGISNPQSDTVISEITEIFPLLFKQPLADVIDFLEGFALAGRKRLQDNSVWATGFTRAHIYNIMRNNVWDVERQKPLAKLCAYILQRLPPRIRMLEKNESLLKAFQENVRETCNDIGLSTGPVGRTRKKREI